MDLSIKFASKNYCSITDTLFIHCLTCKKGPCLVTNIAKYNYNLVDQHFKRDQLQIVYTHRVMIAEDTDGMSALVSSGMQTMSSARLNIPPCS